MVCSRTYFSSLPLMLVGCEGPKRRPVGCVWGRGKWRLIKTIHRERELDLYPNSTHTLLFLLSPRSSINSVSTNLRNGSTKVRKQNEQKMEKNSKSQFPWYANQMPRYALFNKEILNKDTKPIQMNSKKSKTLHRP